MCPPLSLRFTLNSFSKSPNNTLHCFMMKYVGSNNPYINGSNINILSLNSDSYFDKYRGEIYPIFLKLNKENEDSKSATFLDLGIKVGNRQFHTTLYDKRDDFDFEIVNFPNLSGNIPKIFSYGVFTSQVLRYAIACQEYQDVKTRSAMLVKKLLQQNYEIVYLKRTLKKFMSKYSGVISEKIWELVQNNCTRYF